jgi:F-type H+-transporting ATPase subunit delta
MTPHTDAISQVYARSLYELADEAGGREKILEVGQELEQICELARGDRAFREFLGSPIVDNKRRAETLASVFADRITDLTLRFLLVLNAKGRLGHLEAIGESYDQLVHAAFGRIEVDVYTAGPIAPEQLAVIQTRIGESLGKEAVLYPYEDPSMIAGIRLRVGDQLIDGSVASRLRRMRQTLRGTAGSDLGDRIARFIEEGGAS